MIFPDIMKGTLIHYFISNYSLSVLGMKGFGIKMKIHMIGDRKLPAPFLDTYVQSIKCVEEEWSI